FTDFEQTLESQFSVTQSLSSDTDNILPLIQTAGPNQVWDFTSLTFQENFTGVFQNFEDPEETPEFDDEHFAQATHVTSLQLSHTDTLQDEEYEVFQDIYGYVVLSEDQLLSLGAVFIEGVRENDEFEDEISIVYLRPGRIDFQFPLNYEDSWEYDYEAETVFGDNVSTTNFEVVTEVDGWGEIITEGGTEDVLRIKRTESVEVGGNSIESYEYIFINQRGLEVAAISGENEFFDPEEGELQASNISYSTSTSVENPDNLPKDFALNQNYPNPFNPSTVIGYQLPVNSEVQLEVFDVMGRKVATLINGETKSAGNHRINFDAGEFSSGTYIYRLTAGGNILTRKLMLIK
ncbi:MAG: T9SS type A sorting domain-containing protein, partial [Balneolaceae bacterium]